MRRRAERGEAEKLALDDAQKLRFTQQQPFLGGGPKPQPLKWQGFTALREVMVHFQAPLETLFWEALDLPLSQLERLKTLRVRILLIVIQLPSTLLRSPPLQKSR